MVITRDKTAFRRGFGAPAAATAACRLATRTLAAIVLSAATATAAGSRVEPAITIEGNAYRTWNDYYTSDYFVATGKRCGKPPTVVDASRAADPSDCTVTSTNPSEDYETVDIYEIPVVVHIIEHTNGDGQISDALVQSQIDVLNEDFRALPGTPGANGFDVGIRFVLASTDPMGNPTNGITRSVNNTWFNDNGSYWNTLAWDTSVYMNVYTNNAGGNLGYVPDLPQGAGAGRAMDRVVILWSAFGRDAAGGPPFDQGRTLTHEVGHYLGLEHTFNGGCGASTTPGCYTDGDLICDTNPEQSDTSGCPGSKTSCGSSDPIDNYMDYSDDTCMELFTREQSRRMRCSLLNYRPDLYSTDGGALCGNDVRESGESCDGSDAAACPGLCQGDCSCPPPVCGNGTIEAGEQCEGSDPGQCPTAVCDPDCTCEDPSCGNDVIEAGEECDGADPGACPTGVCDPDCTCAGPACGNDVVEGTEACDGSDDGACPGLCQPDCLCPVTCNGRDLFVVSFKSDANTFRSKLEIDNFSGSYDAMDPRNGFDLRVGQGSGSVTASVPALHPGWAKSKPDKGKYKWKGDLGGIRVVKTIDRSASKGIWRVLVKGKQVPGAQDISLADPTEITVELDIDSACVAEAFRMR